MNSIETQQPKAALETWEAPVLQDLGAAQDVAVARKLGFGNDGTFTSSS